MQIGDVQIDPETGRLHRGGHLRPRELSVLRLLWQREGRPVPAEELLARVWDRPPDASRGVLYTTLRRLREAVEPDPSRPRHLVTTRAGIALERDTSPPGTLLRDETLPFHGREAELQALTGSSERRVQLVGLPGMGRSRLAREAARRLLARCPGGVWGLDGTRPEAHLAEQLGVSLEELERRLRRLPPALVVVHAPAEEHGPTLRRWVRWAPTLRVWSTGRVAHAADPGAVVAVPPLPRDEAVALARSALPAGLTADDAALEALVDAVGGVPGALRVAAPLVASTGLDTALEVLCAPHGALARLAESWVEGRPEHAQALRELRAFETFALDELAAVVRVPQPERWLPALRATGMLREASGRLALAPLLTRALQADDGARQRHLAWFSSQADRLVEAAGGRVPAPTPEDAARVGEWVTAAHTALDLQRSGHGGLFELAIRYARRCGRTAAARSLYFRAASCDLDPAADVRVRAIGQQRLELLHAPEQYVVAETLSDDAHQRGELAVALWVRLTLCTGRHNRGEDEVATRHLEVVERWLRGAVPERVRAWATTRTLELRALLQQDDGLFEAAYRAAAEATRVLGEPEHLGRARYTLAQIRARQWRLDDAIALMTAALSDAHLWAPGMAIPQLRAHLALVLARRGRADAARQALAEADAEWATQGDRPYPLLEAHRARILLTLGQRADAHARALEARRHAHEAGDGRTARNAWRTALVAAGPAAELADPLRQLVPDLLAHREYEGAIDLAGLAVTEHLAGRMDDVQWVVERIEQHTLGSLAVDWCTVLAELPTHRDRARALAQRLADAHDRPRLRWLTKWLDAEAGQRVRPTFDDSGDPWVAIYQARLWRLLGRPVQVDIELRRVPELPTEPLLSRARADLLAGTPR